MGYMRLRHGYFRVECRNEVVYAANPIGDGSFCEEERSNYLNAGCRAILDALVREAGKEEGKNDLFYITERKEE